MGIISYAQNFEDVMLWRALKNVKNGFYIDIGANHPVVDSVTKLFYENGWSGINVEPELELVKLLNEDRPEDLNLNMAISSKVTSIKFHVSSVLGWSTTDKDTFANLKDKGSFFETRTVQSMSLDKICEDNNVDIIHFLKIDVEGAEKDVLESFSFNKVRPWICVIEATKPTTQIDTSSEWESILIKNKYILTYFDGLNKFYIADEHSELDASFKTPPNVFDEYILKNHQDAKVNEAEIKAKLNEAEAKAKVNEVEAKASEAQAKVSEAEAKTSNILSHYKMIQNSTSWKITKPIRMVGDKLKWFKRTVYGYITFAPYSRPKRVLKRTLISMKHSINTKPKFKMKIKRILYRFPILRIKLQNTEKDSKADFLIPETDRKKDESSFKGYNTQCSLMNTEDIYNAIKKEITTRKGNQ